MIELKRLSKVFDADSKNITAVNDVSLTIEKGDVYGIIGLSGAGKSTLVRCINYLETPTGGSVVYSPKAMAHLKENAVIIYLRISFETMMKRIADMNSRGILLKNGETIEAMFGERKALYENFADAVLDCDGKPVETTVSEIVATVSEK